MRVLLVVLLVGCTSTRQLASTTDPRLRTGGHTAGFVVKTTTPWRERIDPSSVIQLRNASGAWTPQLWGRDLHVDGTGVWVEAPNVRPVRFADQIEITGTPDELVAALAAAQPASAELHQTGDTVVLAAERGVLAAWIAAVSPGPKVHAIRVHTAEQGWRAPLYHSRLVDMDLLTTSTRLGWRWDEVAAIKVRNLSGGKTAGAIVGTAAVAVVVAPILLLASTAGGVKNYDGPTGRSSGPTLDGTLDTAGKLVDLAIEADRAHPRGTWAPRLAPAESLSATPLFSTGAQWRAVIRPTVSLDAGAASAGDSAGTGLALRVRLGDVFEIGGGVREVWAHDARGWLRSTTKVFQAGLHLPLDAGYRFALPLGFEASGGGHVAHDLRVPWGLRITSASGRYFVTAMPATPQWMRTTTQQTGRWAWNASAELGVSF